MLSRNRFPAYGCDAADLVCSTAVAPSGGASAMNSAIDGLTRRGFLRAAGGTALAVGAGGALTACGGGGDTGGSATKELSFVYMGTAEQQATWNKLFAKFGE